MEIPIINNMTCKKVLKILKLQKWIPPLRERLKVLMLGNRKHRYVYRFTSPEYPLWAPSRRYLVSILDLGGPRRMTGRFDISYEKPCFQKVIKKGIENKIRLKNVAIETKTFYFLTN